MTSRSIKFLILTVLLLSIWLWGRHCPLDLEYLKETLARYPIFISGLIFILLHVGVTFFVMPAKDVFKIVGAVFFGVYGSTFLIWIAEVVDAGMLFSLSRTLGRGFVDEKLKGRYARLDKRMAELNFWDLFLLRAVILVPFRFLDLAAGLAGIPFRRYFQAVFWGSPVRIFFIQYFLVITGGMLWHNTTLIQEYFLTNPCVAALSFLYILASVYLIFRLKAKMGSSKKESNGYA